MVPPARLELALSYLNQILNLARLPIPPQGPCDQAAQFSHSGARVNAAFAIYRQIITASLTAPSSSFTAAVIYPATQMPTCQRAVRPVSLLPAEGFWPAIGDRRNNRGP